MKLSEIAEDIIDYGSFFDLQMVVYDQWGFKDLTDLLEAQDFSVPMQTHPQGLTRSKTSGLCMNDSITFFEGLVKDKKVKIVKNPALRSAVFNCAFYTGPSGARRFEKSKSFARIDMAVASAMAAGAAKKGSDMPNIDGFLSNPVVF